MTVSGACFAYMGNDVLCLEVDPAKLKVLEDGGIPIYDPACKTWLNAVWPPGGFTSPPPTG